MEDRPSFRSDICRQTLLGRSWTCNQHSQPRSYDVFCGSQHFMRHRLEPNLARYLKHQTKNVTYWPHPFATSPNAIIIGRCLFRCDYKKGKCSFYIAQNPVRWTAQSALRVLPSLNDLFIPTPTRLLREAF